MSRFYVFDLPQNITEGLVPFKLDTVDADLSDRESDSDSDSGESSSENEELDARERYKPAVATFSSAVTKYDDDEEESMEEWQWANRAHITGTPFVYFTNSQSIASGKALSIYKAWFDSEKIATHPVDELLSMPKSGKSCVLMVESGHFAGAIISHERNNHKTNISNPAANIKVLHSKTFHRYTTRRKQGGAQSASDAARGKANSAGSTIRRANERMLQEEIKELLASWSTELRDCHRIFFKASGRSNKQLITGYNDAPIASNDERLSRIPFASGRPTLNECKNAWLQLTQAHIVDQPKPTLPNIKRASPAPKSRQSSPAPVVTPANPVEIVSSKLVDLIKRSKLPAIKNVITNELNDDFDFRLKPEQKYAAFPTPLLYAAHNDKPNVVSQLLLWGADPLIKNEQGLTLGEIAAPNKRTKEALQVARGSLGEEKWDWKKAKVAQPVTKEKLLAKEMAEKLKIRQENERLAAEQEEKERKIKMEKLLSKHGSGKRASGMNESATGLSQEDLKQVERERRARAAEARLARFS